MLIFVHLYKHLSNIVMKELFNIFCITQVQKFTLPQEELSRKYPQIKGFHFISCYTQEGIKELQDNMLEVTLQQKYMGERIPQAWLDFESSMVQ